MSQENVELVRRSYDAFNRPDFDRLAQFLHPEVELSPALVGPGVRSHYRGHEEVKGFWKTITEVWDSMTVEPKELIEAPDGRVVAVENWRVRGRDGIEIDTEMTDVYEIRDGFCVRIEGFRDKSEALKAAGLSESDS
jgi:ketosteroid isomerase-like protein